MLHRRAYFPSLGWLLATSLLTACSSSHVETDEATHPDGNESGTDGGTNDGDAPPHHDCSPGVWTCYGDLAHACDDDGRFGRVRYCAAEDMVCADGLGCVSCIPGSVQCKGSVVSVCNDEGTGYEEARDCIDEGKVCYGDRGCVSCIPGTATCNGSVATTCNDEGTGYDPPLNCEAENKVCHPGLGCVSCIPGETRCANGVVRTCNDTGTGHEERFCDQLQGQLCLPTGCVGGCQPEVIGSSHLGCDFFPTNTPHAATNERLAFAVTIANGNDEAARIYVTKGDTTVLTKTIAAQSVEVIELPWVEELVNGTDVRIVPQGAYRIRSNGPIAVHQHHGPSLVEPPPDDCTEDCEATTASSTLLLPAHVLGQDYTTLTWGNGSIGDAYYLGAATQYGTLVELGATPGTISDTSPGSAIGMNPGDVVRVFGWSDVSGQRIRSNRPVQVIVGRRCANVPLNLRDHCDHIEEALLPHHSWGREHFVTAPANKDAETVFHALRIAVREPDTKVTIEPSGGTYTLGPGDPPLDFSNKEGDVIVRATKPVLVASFLQGFQPLSDADSGASQGMVTPKESSSEPRTASSRASGTTRASST